MPGVGPAHAGTSTDSKWTPFTETLTGEVHRKVGSVSSTQAVTVWDSSTGSGTTATDPVTFDKLWLWTDAAGYIQLISTSGSGTNVTLKVAGDDPFTLSDGDLLAAANETAISAGAQSVQPIQKVVLTTSGATAVNYVFFVAT
jgi:hypothetical protein